MTKVYVLFYDTDHGDREDWNVFYTPREIFPTPELRQARIDFIKSKVSDPELDFETHDIEISTIADFKIDSKILGFGYDNEPEDDTFEDENDV